MPLVRRIVTQDVESFFGKQKHPHVLYVPPSKVQPKDEVVPVDEISDRQLKDLATSYPREYGKAAEARGLDLGADDPSIDDLDLDDLDEDDDDLDDEDESTGDDEDEDDDDEEDATSRESFVILSAADAAAAVAAQEDPKVLADWLDSEKSRRQPRASVVKAFKAKGLE